MLSTRNLVCYSPKVLELELAALILQVRYFPIRKLLENVRLGSVKP